MGMVRSTRHAYHRGHRGYWSVVRRIVAGVVVALLAGVLGAPVAAAADPAVAKVVIVVGPSGAATDRYRAEAREAARLARRYTPDVTQILSPDATWPAVREALQGASLVLYMGHGNGWPSRYRDSPYPATQNGFGLNPSPGSGDDAHQYFGEGRIADEVRLARNAVVLLHHLCYASGLSEPGLPEGSLAVARQRVDNFAAGFVRAGAAAVIAEAYAKPEHMIRTILGGRRSIEAAWRSAPSAHGNAFAFASERSPGYVAMMDPAHGSSGFERSIVLREGLASADVLRHASGSRAGGSVAPVDPALLVPSLVRTGVRLDTPSIAGATLAGGKVYYRIPFSIADRSALPETIQASARWDRLDPEPAVAEDTAADDAGPDFGLIVAERPGDVVAPATLSISRTRMALHVATPATPGRYRLTLTLHDAEGVAYDAETQALVPAYIVRVTREHDAAIDAPAALDLVAGDATAVPLWVVNLGREPWGRTGERGTTDVSGRKDATSVTSATHARLTGTWIALGPTDAARDEAVAAASVTPVELPAAMAPRAAVRAELRLYAPTVPGDYLVLVDIVSPEAGSLAALGVDPTIIRVRVTEGTDPAAS